MSVAGGFRPWTLTLSDDGVALLKSVEKLYLQPYDDQTSKGIQNYVSGATIGYGHLIEKADWGKYKNGISAEAATSLFVSELVPFIRAVGSAITVGLQQHQFDALVILAFNIGIAGFNGSAIVKLVNDPRTVTVYSDLETAWKAWNKSQGKFNPGLVNRRACEWKIYTKAIYERW